MKSRKQTREWERIENTTIGAALADLEGIADESINNGAQRVYDALMNSVPRNAKRVHLAIAALRLARKALVMHSDGLAEIDAEIRREERLGKVA